MKRMCVRLTGMLLAIGFVALFVAGPSILADDIDPKEAKAAQKAVVELSKMSDAKMAEAAKGLAKKHPIDVTMVIFKPRSRLGIGVGDEPNKIIPDSIELKIMNMARGRGLTPLKLKRESEAMVVMAKRIKAMAEITRHQPNKAAKDEPKGLAGWKKYIDEQVKGSNELIKALEGKKDKAEIVAASKIINSSCINCHSDFRDN